MIRENHRQHNKNNLSEKNPRTRVLKFMNKMNKKIRSKVTHNKINLRIKSIVKRKRNRKKFITLKTKE